MCELSSQVRQASIQLIRIHGTALTAVHTTLVVDHNLASSLGQSYCSASRQQHPRGPTVGVRSRLQQSTHARFNLSIHGNFCLLVNVHGHTRMTMGMRGEGYFAWAPNEHYRDRDTSSVAAKPMDSTLYSITWGLHDGCYTKCLHRTLSECELLRT